MSNTFERKPKGIQEVNDTMAAFDALPLPLQTALNNALIPMSAELVLDMYWSVPQEQRTRAIKALVVAIEKGDRTAHVDAVRNGETPSQANFRVEMTRAARIEQARRSMLPRGMKRTAPAWRNRRRTR